MKIIPKFLLGSPLTYKLFDDEYDPFERKKSVLGFDTNIQLGFNVDDYLLPTKSLVRSTRTTLYRDPDQVVFDDNSNIRYNLPTKIDRTKWYSDLDEANFQETNYRSILDGNLVNPLDYGNRWTTTGMSTVKGSTRFNPTKGVTSALVAKAESEKYYLDFLKRIFQFDSNNNPIGFTKEGLEHYRRKDADNPDEKKLFNSKGVLYNSGDNKKERVWYVKGKDALGNVTDLTFETPWEYAYYAMTDKNPGLNHNIEQLKGDRYFYTRADGTRGWVDPEEATSGKYILKLYSGDERPESFFDPNTRTTWTDYEIIGLEDKLQDIERPSLMEQVRNDVREQVMQQNDKENPPGFVKKNFTNIPGGDNKKKNWLSKLNLGKFNNPFLLGGLRTLADNLYNTYSTEKYIEGLSIPYQIPEQDHRMIHGDYIAEQNAEALAARLRSQANLPFTADADRQMSYLLEAIDKGNKAILAGLQRDALEFYRTSELAANLEKENIHNRVTTANTNRQLASQYDEMVSRLRHNNRVLNMLNWDKWASVWEDRALAKYDYNLKRLQDMQETMDDLATGVGIDTTKYDNLVALYYKAENDPAKLLEILAKIKAEGRKIKLQKYYNLGNYRGVTWNKEWTDLFTKEGIISSVKNGGVLRKMQLGGGFPLVQWTPLMGSPYLQYLALLMSGKDGASSKSSKKSSSSSDKQEASLAKSIIETLKGGDLLLSDMNVIAALMTKFFDLLKYSLDDELDENTLYRGYISMLSQVNRAKQSANNFKEAYENVNKNGGLHEPAVNLQGLVYVGIKGTDKLSVVTPELYFENEDKYILMTNLDLLYLRQNHPSQAFDDTNILSAASNGVGMELVSKFVKEIVGTLGHDKNSRDLLVYNFGELAAQGLKVLEDLKSKGFTTEETNAVISGGLKALWELNTVTLDLYKQASLAIGAVWQSLPANMRSLLTLRTGSREGAVDLVSKMILSGTTYESSFKVSDITPLDENGNLKSSTKTSTGGSGDDKMKLTAASNLALGFGNPVKFVITPNGKDSKTGWHVSGNLLPITDGSDKNIGNTTMDELTRAFGGMLDLSHAYMGNSRISSLGTGLVWIHTGLITLVALPKDPNVNYNKPHFERFRLVSEADDILEKEGINSSKVGELTLDLKKRVNEVYQSKGLAPKYDLKGNLNLIAYAYFGLVKGTASEKAFELDVTFDHDFMFPATDVERSNFELHMKKANSDFSISDRWEIGPVKLGDQVFTGTIFIPLNTDLISTQSGYGSTYAGSPSQNMTLDVLRQQEDAIKEQGRPPLDIIKRNFNE